MWKRDVWRRPSWYRQVERWMAAYGVIEGSARVPNINVKCGNMTCQCLCRTFATENVWYSLRVGHCESKMEPRCLVDPHTGLYIVCKRRNPYGHYAPATSTVKRGEFVRGPRTRKGI